MNQKADPSNPFRDGGSPWNRTCTDQRRRLSAKDLASATIRTTDPHGLAPIDTTESRMMCDCCLAVRKAPTRLVHEQSGKILTACFRCLRSVMHTKVDEADYPKHNLLLHSAEKLGWQVWRSGPMLYLLPPVFPFVAGRW